MIRLIAAAMLALRLPVSTAAQEGPEMAADLAGEWQIVPVDGSPSAPSASPSRPHAAVGRRAPGPLCATYAAAAKTVGWTFEDGMRLLDAQGAP